MFLFIQSYPIKCIISPKTVQKMKEAKEDIEAVKASLGRSNEELQQWVSDVKQWASQGACSVLLSIFV